MTMVQVKICGITILEDAISALEAGADAIGFNFYRRSARYIDPSRARSIVKRLPKDILTVGVFVNQNNPDDVASIADEAGVNAVQLHGDESPEFCRALKDRFVIKALRVGTGFMPESAAVYETEAIMLDTFVPMTVGGTGRTFDWTLARRTRELVPKLYLAGGLSHRNVADAIAMVDPFAVDACSCLESSPGRKDARLVHIFVKTAKQPVLNLDDARA
jgi:phosphoribosylanthranilate isomerase